MANVYLRNPNLGGALSAVFVIRASSFSFNVHVPRKRRSRFRSHDKPDTDCNQEEQKELAAGERSYQGCIGFAEIFNYDTKQRVQNKKQSRQYSIRLAGARAHEPQNGEQNDSFENCLVELRWMARRQNRAQRGRDLWFTMHRAENRVRRG